MEFGSLLVQAVSAGKMHTLIDLFGCIGYFFGRLETTDRENGGGVHSEVNQRSKEINLGHRNDLILTAASASGRNHDHRKNLRLFSHAERCPSISGLYGSSLRTHDLFIEHTGQDTAATIRVQSQDKFSYSARVLWFAYSS
ncbi:hypothetical protein BJV74DRAFT_107754 [Russula compacta]|nr:hypothetical protein BJV74DRAFT_107754 [Russula compacta]